MKWSARMTRRRRWIAPGVLVLVALSVAPGEAEDSTPLVGPFTRDTYPQAVIDRPLTLPAGMVEGESGWQFVSQRFVTPIDFATPLTFASSGTDDWNADVALRVGVTDRVQVEAGTAFSLDHSIFGASQVDEPFDDRPSLASWSRTLPVRLSYLALDTRALDTALTLTLPFHAHADRIVTFTRGGKIVASDESRVLPAVALEAPTRWRLCDWLWLRAGEDLFSVTTGDGVATFAFDVGVGVQAHRLLAFTIDSRVASIAFDGSGHEASETVADVGSLALQTVFAPLPWLDFVGGVDVPDLGRGFGDYATRIAVRVRI
jgi:hypothetical protein